MIYEKTGVESGALRQGEIITGLVQALVPHESIKGNSAQIRLVPHPFAMVLTQDCDLEWDFKARRQTASAKKLLAGILICEVVEALELKRRAASSKEWEWMKDNRIERYQFLQKVLPVEDAADEGLPELGVDFKRYFTLPAEEIYRQIEHGRASRRCCLTIPLSAAFHKPVFLLPAASRIT